MTTSDDGTPRVWDTETGEQVGVLEGHEGQVNSAAYSPDGQWIVTASDDRTARVWPSIDELLELAGSLIQREPPTFTGQERVRYGVD